MTSWNVWEDTAALMMPLENSYCPYYYEVKFSPKIKQFCCYDFKFHMPLLFSYIASWTLAKIWQILWNDLKIRTAPIITSWNFPKNKAVLLKWFENLNCPYHHKLAFSQKRQNWWCHWKIELGLLSRGKILAKIRQFSWCDLNIWPSAIITSGRFRKNKADLLKRFGNLNYAYYHRLKFSQKWGSFDGITW